MTANPSSGASIQDGNIAHDLHLHALEMPYDWDVLPIGATNSPLTSLGAAAPAVAEIASSKQSGMLLTTGDVVTAKLNLLSIPWDLSRDLLAEIEFACSNAAAVTGLIFDLYFKGMAVGEVWSDVTSSPDKQLTFPALATVGQNKLAVSGRIALNKAGTFLADRRLLVGLKMTDDGSAAGDEVYVTAVNLYGTRRLCHGSGDRQYT